MPILTILPNLQMGGTESVAALDIQTLTVLSLHLDDELTRSIMITGNTLPISQAGAVPSGEPPGGKGVVFHISGGVLTIYVWDADTSGWVT
jgi:hypothetical protein